MGKGILLFDVRTVCYLVGRGIHQSIGAVDVDCGDQYDSVGEVTLTLPTRRKGHHGLPTGSPYPPR